MSEPTYSQLLEKLEGIIEKMSRADLELEESVLLYEEGMETYRSCSKLLNGAEARLTKIREDSEGNPAEEEFFLES